MRDRAEPRRVAHHLLERYEGAYPLAIASYNGGPFNVSGWLDGTGADMPMDAWVEHIPFRETRDYVKNVLSNTVYYAALFEGRPQSLKARLGYIAP